MTPLPPLPLVDGHFLIDNSSLEQFQGCRRLWELSSLRRYTLVANRAGRNFGSGFHAAMRHRYTTWGTAAVPPHGLAELDSVVAAYFEANPQPVEDFRDASHCQRMVRAYLDHRTVEPFRILPSRDGGLLVERSFALHLGNVQATPVVWTGRIDIGMEDNDGIWSFDHKTTFQYGSGFDDEMATNGGQLGYVWALGQVLGKKPTGYVINGIRVRKPSKAAKYGDGGGPAPIDASDFVRIPHHVTQDALDEWREDVLALINNLFFCHDTGSFPRSRRSCSGKYGRCDFFEVCTAPRHTRQAILDSSLYGPNTWSPLNQPSTTNEKPS